MCPVPISRCLSAISLLFAATAVHAQTGEIRGRVTAQTSGLPIAGITVQVELRNGPWAGSAVTDVNGDYVVGSLDNGTYVVRALSGGGYAGELWDGVNEFDYDLASSVVIDAGEAEAGRDFALWAAGSVSGSVSGLVSGESVNLELQEAVSGRYRGGTNSVEGPPGVFTYTLPNVPPGSYRLRANPGGTDRAFQFWNGKTRDSEADLISVAESQAVGGKDFTLVQGGSIAGTLTLSPAAGSPLGMWVEAHDPTNNRWAWSAFVSIDASAAYTLTNLPAGSWVVHVNTGGSTYVREFYSSVAENAYGFPQATAVAVSAGGMTSGIDLTLEPGRTISGRVFLDDGDNVDEGEPGVPDAQVNANLETCCFGSGTRADANGNYTLTGLQPGRYFLEAQSTSPGNLFVEERYNNHVRILDNARDVVDVTGADAAGVDFGVEAGQVISGTVFHDLNGNGVRDAGEAGVSNGSVRAWVDGTERCCSHAQLGADGAYALALPPGTYRVDASSWSGLLLREYWNSNPGVNAFFFEDGSPITPPQTGTDFSLLSATTYGTLRGELRAPGSGLPVPGVNVRVQRFSTGRDVGGGQTGVDGRFVISGLPPAEYKVLFDTQSSNASNNQDLVAEYWTRCQTQSCPAGVIDPNDQKVTFPATPAPPGGPGADVGVFTLTQGGSIQGTVDIVGGGSLPLPFNVNVQSFVSGGPSQPFLPGAPVSSDGSYRVRGLPAPHTYKVQAQPFGSDYVPVYYQTASTSTFENRLAGPVDVAAGVATTGIDLHLFRGGSISGRVTCALGLTPVANYPVQIDRLGSGGFGVRPRTDANGNYIGRGLPGGEYSVRADSRGESFAGCGSLANETYPAPVAVSEGADTPNIDFDLAAGVTISGRVTQIVDGQSEPVVNLRVSASDYTSNQFVSDAHTDANGDYAIGGLAPGTSYRLRAETRDRPDDPQFFNFIQEYYDNAVFFSSAAAVTAPASGKDFLLELGGAISGSVSDEGTGAPLSGINVCADIFAGGGLNNCDLTDQNGFYVVRGLPAGNWRVRANPFPQNYVSEYYDNALLFSAATPVTVAAVPPGGPVPITSNINFGLAAGAAIQGRIFFDADGDGVQAVSGEPGLGGVCVSASSTDGLLNFGGACSTANGDYTFSGLPPGSYVLSVMPTGTPYAGEFFRLVDGKAVGTPDRLQAQSVTPPAVGVDFSLVLGGAIKGVVRAFGGGPLANVRINANPFTGQGLGAGATSDASGNYRIDGLPAGQYRLQARDNNGVYVFEYHSTATPDAFFFDQATAVDAGVGETSVDFELVLGGAIEGDVYDDANANLAKDDGEGVLNANITVSEFAAPNRCCLGSGNTRTDAGGHFRLGGLPPGMNLRVQASPPAGSDLVAVFYDGGDDKGTIVSSSAAAVSVTAGGTFSPANFALERGGAVEGVVYYDADGDGFRDPGEPGLSGVTINVSTPTFCCFGQDRQTDSNGHFRVRGISPGDYRVQANPPGGTDYVTAFYDGGNDQGALISNNALLLNVSASGTAVANFGLNLGASISGIVYQDLDDNGAGAGSEPGVANVPINVNVKIGTQFFCCFGNGNRNTDSSGAYVLRGIPAATAAGPAEIRLQVNASPTNNPTDFVSIFWDGGDDKGPSLQSLAASIFPNPGDQLAGFNFALTLGGSISGFLRDGNGDPIANFCCLNAQSLVTNVAGRGSFTTGATGAYTIRGLAPGLYRVQSNTPAGFTQEWWNNQTDQLAADPVTVQAPASCGASGSTGCQTSGIDFYLTKRPQLVSGPTQTAGAQGTTVTGIQLSASATTLLGAACGSAPCSRVEAGGTGVTVQNLSLSGGVFTFDLVIAAGAPLGLRSLSIVNDYTLANEDAALVIPSAFEVTAAGAPVSSPERVYASDLDMGELRAYGASDNALLGRIEICCDPGAIALQGNRLAYVTGSDRSLAVVDLELGKEVYRTTSIGAFGAYAVAVAGNYVYVVNRELPLNNRVQVFDALTWEPKGYVLVGHSPFPVGANPFSLRLDAAGRLWVVNAGAANTPASVTILDTTVDPASPGVRLATISFPAGFSARGVAFSPDFDGAGPRGPYAYVVGQQNTFVLDTALVTGADPSLAFIDVDASAATGFSVGSRSGISPIPTRGGGNGAIEITPLPGDGRTVAYVTEGAQVRVIDLSSSPDQPRFVKTFAAGFFGSTGIRATADGSRVFFSYNASKDLWALDTAGLLLSPAVNLTRVDRDRGPSPGDALLVGGVALGPAPVAPASRPSVVAVLPSLVENGPSDFTVTLTGTGFDVDVAKNLPVVWLAGTLTRGTVLTGSTSSSLQVRFPGHTPSGDHAIVVTNGQAGGNVSSTGSAILQVRAGASYAPANNVFVTSFGRNKVFVYGQAAPSDPPAEIATQPGAGGLAITPDGRAGIVNELYFSAIPSANDDWGSQDSNTAVFDLDPSHAGFRTVTARLPFVGSFFESPAVTPDLADPDGVFAYAANRAYSDTVSVIDPFACVADPAGCREIDMNPAPGTQTYPLSGDPRLGDLGSRLPAGLSRIELDAQPTNFDKQPVEVAVSPDGSRLYVANLAAGAGVSIVRASDGFLLGRYTFDGNRADGNLRAVTNLAVSPNGARLYAVGLDSALGADNLARPFVYVFDTSVVDDGEASLVGCHQLPTTPLPGDNAPEFKELGRGITITPDGATAYVVARLRGELWVLDLTAENPGVCAAPAAVVPLKGQGVAQHALAGNYLYVANNFKSEVYVYDVTNRLSPQFVTTLGAACAGDVALQPSFSAPVLSAVFPTSGPAAGGTPVTLSGQNFVPLVPGTSVTFNGAPASDVVVQNSYTITATTPAGADGPATVRVTNPDSQFSEVSGRFRYQSDFTPPVFQTNPPALMVGPQTLVGTCPACSVSVEIGWATDEASDSLVGYGTTSALGSSRNDPALVTTHSVMLTGLATSTLYHFRVTSRDAAGNAASHPAAPATVSFTTLAQPDTTAPVILVGPSVAVTHDSALVQWSTNESSTSEAEYALAGGPLGPAPSGATGTGHAVSLAGLAADTLYDYRVTSRDASGNAVSSAVLQFRTSPTPDTAPPDPLPLGPGENVTVSYLSNDLVIVTWTTDEPSTSFVNYGVSSVNEQGVIDVTPVTTHIVFLTNLLPGTVYGFQFGSTDASGNTFLSDDPFGGILGLSAMTTTRLKQSRRVGVAVLQAGSTVTVAAATSGFTTPEAPDTTAPILTTPVAITPLGFDRVQLTSATDEAASILVRYGVLGLDRSAFDASFTLSQSLVLAGLDPGTTYQAEVVLTDPKGNSRTISGLSFTTPSAPDTQAPLISGVSVAATQTSAVITWSTDEPADAAVRYGLAGGPLERSGGSLQFGTAHVVALGGLSPGTRYAFEVASRDASGNLAAAAGPPFTTAYRGPEISSVTPNRAAQGASLTLTIAGAALDADAQVSLGADVAVDAVSANPSGTQLLAGVTVSPTAATGPRTLSVTNPKSGLQAFAGFNVVDASVPQITITEPAAGSTLDSRNVLVRGSVSEPSAVAVNGVTASVAADLSYSATITLSGAGARRIVVTATDASGNRGSAAVDVVLAFVDTTPPSLSLSASPAVLWPPNHQMLPVAIAVSVADDTDPAPSVVLVSVTSNEPDDEPGSGDGATTDDIQGVTPGSDDRLVSLRAERLGSGSGRVYTLRYRATDQAGNSVEQTVEVRVPHDQGR